MRQRRSAFPALHVLGALSLAGWGLLVLVSRGSDSPLLAYLGLTAWAWLWFVLAWWVCRRDPGGGRLLGPLLLWSLAFRLAGFFAVPVMEDDYFRFLWDGRQFALTGNPYAMAPAAYFAEGDLPDRFREILDQINYPHVPTIYGPICQAGFALSYWMAPGQLWPWKLMVIGADLLALALVHRLATNGRVDPWEGGSLAASASLALLVFGWCPLAIFETSFNAHPDILGVALLLAALACWRTRAVTACAVFCGLAVAAKVFALFLVPFLLGRRARAWAWFAVALGLAYAPFWLQGSLADWTGLKAFAEDWEFNSSLFALFRTWFGPFPAKGIGASLFALLWLGLLARWLANARDLHPATIPPGTALFGGFLLLSATVNPWYLLWLLPFLAFKPGAAGLVALAAVSLSYITGLNLGDTALTNFEHPSWVRPVEYGIVALAGMIDWWRARSTGCQMARTGSLR